MRTRSSAAALQLLEETGLRLGHDGSEYRRGRGRRHAGRKILDPALTAPSPRTASARSRFCTSRSARLRSTLRSSPARQSRFVLRTCHAQQAPSEPTLGDGARPPLSLPPLLCPTPHSCPRARPPLSCWRLKVAIPERAGRQRSGVSERGGVAGGQAQPGCSGRLQRLCAGSASRAQRRRSGGGACQWRPRRACEDSVPWRARRRAREQAPEGKEACPRERREPRSQGGGCAAHDEHTNVDGRLRAAHPVLDRHPGAWLRRGTPQRKRCAGSRCGSAADARGNLLARSLARAGDAGALPAADLVRRSGRLCRAVVRRERNRD